MCALCAKQRPNAAAAMALDFDLFVTRIAIAVVWAHGTKTLRRATRMRPPPMGRQLLSTLSQEVAAISIFYITLIRRPEVCRPRALKFYLRALSRRVRSALDVWGVGSFPAYCRCQEQRAPLAARHASPGGDPCNRPRYCTLCVVWGG